MVVRTPNRILLTLVSVALLIAGTGCEEAEDAWQSPGYFRPNLTVESMMEFTSPVGLETVVATDLDLERLCSTLNEMIRWRGETADYWKTPDETLRHGFGDCEDLAVLVAALLRRDGYSGPIVLQLGRISAKELHIWVSLPFEGVCIDCRGKTSKPMQLLQSTDSRLLDVIWEMELNGS